MQGIKTLADLEGLEPWERDAWFAERFGYLVKEYTYMDKTSYLIYGDGLTVSEYTTTNNGTAELKAEMVKLGYDMDYHYSSVKPFSNLNHIFIFILGYKSFSSPQCDTEIEATWKAAAMALLGE